MIPKARPELAPANNYAVTQFEEYLANLHVTAWGRWTITDPYQRREAAEWYIGQQRKFADWLIASRTSHNGKTAHTPEFDVV